MTIDGQDVAMRGFGLTFEDRKVVGGRDGCNGWSYNDRPRGRAGSRMIIMDLQECPEDDSNKAYWSVSSAAGLRLELAGRDTMRLTTRGHRATLRRGAAYPR